MTDSKNQNSMNNDDIFSVVNTNIFSWRSLKYLLYSPHWMARSFLYLVAITLFVASLFMIFFEVDIVISGRGKIVPSRPAVLLQSDSIKKVKNIYAKLNQRVKKNDAMVEFEGRARDKVIKSPVDGEIIDVFVSAPGEVVSVGDPIIEIVPDGSVKIARIFINEESIARIGQGDQVKVKLDAFPFRKYGLLNGKIDWISQKPEGDRENVYPIMVSLNVPEKLKLLYGMQLTGEVIIGKVKLYRKFVSEIFLQGQEF